MAHGGPRPGSGPKKKKITIPVEALPSFGAGTKTTSHPVPPSSSPSASPIPEINEELLLAKLNELALAGNPIALRLALEGNERRAKVALLEAQTRNLKLRNRVLSDHLTKKGLELGPDEYEPEEDPVQKPQGLKVVGQ